MEHQIPPRAIPQREPPGSSVRSLVSDYLELAKARLGALVVITYVPAISLFLVRLAGG